MNIVEHYDISISKELLEYTLKAYKGLQAQVSEYLLNTSETNTNKLLKSVIKEIENNNNKSYYKVDDGIYSIHCTHREGGITFILEVYNNTIVVDNTDIEISIFPYFGEVFCSVEDIEETLLTL